MTPNPELYSAAGFLRYFLGLGFTGFGGPVALAARMHQDLVHDKKWISEEEYKEGLALAQLAPGPMATQLAIYLGWARGKTPLATAVAFAFVLPSFAIVAVLGEIYLRMNGIPAVQAAFYGIGAAVIAIVGKGAWALGRKTLVDDRILWGIAGVSAVFTFITGTEVIGGFLVAGLANLLWRANQSSGNGVRAWFPAALVTGLHGPAEPALFKRLFLYFAEAGAMVFGSGLAIVPFLHGGVVDRYHWLTENQFLDAVAVAMVTPGPVVIAVAFIGYLLAGFGGATVSALGVFLPCYLLVVIPAPYYRQIAKNRNVKFFIDGVTAATIGAIGAAVGILARRAIHDAWTVLLFFVALGLVIKAKKVPEPVILLGAAIAGILLKR